MKKITQIVIENGVDAHLHVRADERTEIVFPFSRNFTSAATIMPNVIFPKTGKSLMTTEGVLWYYDYLKEFFNSNEFMPMMTFYVGQDTEPEDIRQGYLNGVFKAGKLYPLNATTGSHDGLSKIEDGYPIFAVMEELGIGNSLPPGHTGTSSTSRPAPTAPRRPSWRWRGRTSRGPSSSSPASPVTMVGPSPAAKARPRISRPLGSGATPSSVRCRPDISIRRA